MLDYKFQSKDFTNYYKYIDDSEYYTCIALSSFYNVKNTRNDIRKLKTIITILFSHTNCLYTLCGKINIEDTWTPKRKDICLGEIYIDELVRSDNLIHIAINELANKIKQKPRLPKYLTKKLFSEETNLIGRLENNLKELYTKCEGV
jgi:hypothetical protein